MIRYKLFIYALFSVSVASAQELPPSGPHPGQTYQLFDLEKPLNILSAGVLIPMECTKFTTHEEVKDLPRKGFLHVYPHTTCFKWDASNEYDGDTMDGKCLRMYPPGLGRMREIKAAGSSETLLKYENVISQENVRGFSYVGFVYEQDYDSAKKLENSPWVPTMTAVLEYSC